MIVCVLPPAIWIWFLFVFVSAFLAGGMFGLCIQWRFSGRH